jgi:hypothetical protein
MILGLWSVVNRSGCRARAWSRVASRSPCRVSASPKWTSAGGVEADFGLAVVLVVAVDVGVHELLRIVEAVEPVGERRGAFQCREPALRIGVVLGDPGLGVGAGDLEVGQEVGDGFGGHRGAAFGRGGESCGERKGCPRKPAPSITMFGLVSLTSGAPGRNRTYDRQIRRLLLYPLSYGGRRAYAVRDVRGEF